jgi:GT2 family glycosyltransferase
MPYCRSWALNVGARVAEGRVFVFHDNDMLVPQGYAAEIWNRYIDGYEVVNLKRFIFYLTERHSREVASGFQLGAVEPPDAVVQNSEAGGSVAMSRDAFFAIGGYDESFVGWGGEDNEFWERAQTRRVWPYGYLPIVHLWHPQLAAPGRAFGDPARATQSGTCGASVWRSRKAPVRRA